MQSRPQDELTISGARLIEAVEGIVDADIVVRDGLIAEIRPHAGISGSGTVLDARRLLAAPGLVNGHQHSHELLFRGRSEGLTLEEWMTSVRPANPLPLTAEDVKVRTEVVAAEALRSGTTTLCDDVGIDHVERPDLLDAVAEGYRSAGIRAFVGPSLFDVPFARAVPFADEELPRSQLAAPPRPGVDSQVGAFRTFAMGLRERGGLVQAIGTPSAPQRCSPALLDAVRLLADELGLPVMTHVLETRVQAVGAQRDYGQSMIAYLDQRGFLRPGTSLIHGVWLTRADMEVIAASGASVQHNVWSNLKLGSGLARLRAMLDAGVNVSLGSDGCGSIETVSLLPTMAAAALLSGLRGGPEHAVSASEVFHAATTGGARALGLEAQVGKIAIGHRADIVLYRLDRAPFVPLNDAVRQLVYGMPAAGVDTVIVDGRVVVRDGRLLTLDEEDLYRRMIEIQTRMRSGIEEAERQATLLRPGMASIRCRCARIGLGELDSVSSGFLP